MLKFNEDSRVKIPTILHLTMLGYKYLSLKDTSWDLETNIFPEIFTESILKLNPKLKNEDTIRLLEDLKIILDNEDLGKAFYEKLTEKSGTRLIDFENFENNTFHVVTELTYKNEDEEFRPDITLFINGMPLAFIEVKKPNNKDGIQAEYNRLYKRFQNKKFKRFINITQIMVFSNNMEYDDNSPFSIEGAFYATPSYKKPVFNFFREERFEELNKFLKPLKEENENFILKDTNSVPIKHSPEFQTNKSSQTSTNRITTSLFSKDRLSFILQYSIAYVSQSIGWQKHIMRYPQIFATYATRDKLDKGIKKGIIWHTQGSGKTAFAYYNVHFLTDYFQKKSIIPKFYFIVDRLDLLIQAQREFTSRGLVVHTIQSREEFARDIKKTEVIHNDSGNREITVVNIQKFKDDPDVVKMEDYNVSVQRVYFLDEVHRSYNPKGSFLANLEQSDRNAIKIGLTGTPLLGDDYNSKKLFGGYIHKYYYNASIADGYTLRLIREEIETKYKLKLKEALKELEVLKGGIKKEEVYAHKKFVEPMVEYIVHDFESTRKTFNDDSIGGMVICESSGQARKAYEVFLDTYAVRQEVEKERNLVKTAALILHDEGTKKERERKIEDFKEGKIDFLFVYNMLLTGFDAQRLKKLYLGRVIRKHNLLQALTRVNRTYKDFRYGYVVDFADIRKEFDATNRAYFEELQEELGDEIESYSNLFKSKEEINAEIEEIKDVLFEYDTENAEIFSQQISQIQDKKTIQEIKKVLENARGLYNIIRASGNYEELEKLDFQKLNSLYIETSNHLNQIILKEKMESQSDSSNILNEALEDVVFLFTKISEEELVIADKLKESLRKTREALAGNFDKKDPEFIKLKEELERLFKQKKLNEMTQEAMSENIEKLNEIYENIKELNRKNNLIKAKYQGDEKFVRTHKRIIEVEMFSEKERKIFEALSGVKNETDEKVMNSSELLKNESFFEKSTLPIVLNNFYKKQDIKGKPDNFKTINKMVLHEYLSEFTYGAPN